MKARKDVYPFGQLEMGAKAYQGGGRMTRGYKAKPDSVARAREIMRGVKIDPKAVTKNKGYGGKAVAGGAAAAAAGIAAGSDQQKKTKMKAELLKVGGYMAGDDWEPGSEKPKKK